jgi:putative MATE family efflux protein
MEKDLTSGNISSQIKQLSIPSSIGFFFYTMFNVTDTYFASLIGDNAIAALVLASTVYFLILSISRGMSNAVTSLIGNALGTKDNIKVQNILMHTYIFAAFMTVFLYLFYFLFIDYIFSFTGGDSEYIDSSMLFINIIILGLPFYLTSSYSNAILISHADTKSFRNILIINFFLNIVLNYWFIYGGLGISPLGIEGIAYATISTEILTSLFLLYKVYKLKIVENFDNFKFDLSLIEEIVIQGLPSTLNMILMSLGAFILIYFISKLGADIVAAYGIGIRLEQMALVPSIGISVAVAAMVAQNNGAKDYKRIETIMKEIYKYSFILSFAGLIFMIFTSYYLAPYFTDSVVVLEQTEIYVKINAILLLAYILIFVNVSFLQAIKRPNMIFYIGLFRQIVFPFIFYTIAYYLELGALYYWLGTFLSVFLATVYIHNLQRKYLKNMLKNENIS